MNKEQQQNIKELLKSIKFDRETASTTDRIAYTLCQIIDDDAPIRWTRYRGVAICIALNEKLMQDLMQLKEENTKAKESEDKL
jgi:hypothetical protein